MKQPIKLKTPAIDNRGNLLDVYIEYNHHSDYYPNAPVLRIDRTPGSWYMHTLMDDYPTKILKTISIDAGSNWSCFNFAEILNEALFVCLKGD